jgi:hypothetical protein
MRTAALVFGALSFCFGSAILPFLHTSEKAFNWTSDLQDLQAPKRQTMLPKLPTDHSSHKIFGAVSEDLLRGIGEAEPAELPGAGIGQKQCPGKGVAEKG